MKTHYSALGVDRGASYEEIRAAWKALASATHPDRDGGDPGAFSEASMAWSVLSDTGGARVAYDKSIDLLTAPCAKCAGRGRTFRQKGVHVRIATPCAACFGSGRTERKRK